MLFVLRISIASARVFLNVIPLKQMFEAFESEIIVDSFVEISSFGFPSKYGGKKYSFKFFVST